ncbi:protein phosphatase [Mycoplasmopsis mustelae]|uniref:Protein phosphatase n=1 Tax=Mycoplasmopsis mustelae TaxID=171289 RepID=A0A4R7UBV7_9BACT|nr:PP2C family serine/threonine-protein phosphatase [Mycoplasmopsis mustelae]TDV22697.1 protein phosphatase [Mycoplasmopsis mustelae]
MFKYFFKSEIGNVREKNEDSIAIFEKENCIFAILCDGMGGHKFGEIASNTVVNLMGQNFINNFIPTSTLRIKQFIQNSVVEAKNELKKLAKHNFKMTDMGTTLVGCLIIPKQQKIFVFNVGDSRCYFFLRSNKLIKITSDQNLAQKWDATGFDYLNTENEKYARFLTSAIGPNLETTIDITEIKKTMFDMTKKIILTSDGVHEFVSHIDLEAIISQNKDLKKTVNKIIKKALLQESNDNISVALIEVNNEK